ncbi:hypothetical protein WMY93_008521 [Mugilogobius chulae]|uniref:ribonuclease H n=1 Tax=Mugilogobius chulae TaxID=88201 RepID=A0AAW0PHD2_9GOBI
MHNPESEASGTRPRRRASVPSHLSDYDLSGPGAQIRFKAPAVESTHSPTSSLSPPISQHLDMRDMTVIDDLEEREPSQYPLPATRGQQLTEVVPEFSAALTEMRQENAELRKQFQSLMAALQVKSQPAVHQPHSQPPLLSAYSGGYDGHSQLQYRAPMAVTAPQPLYYPSPGPVQNMAQDFSRLRVSHGPRDLPFSPYPAATPQQRAPRADLYGQKYEASSFPAGDSQYGASYTGRDSSFPQMPYANVTQTELTYRGPKPTIPSFTSPDPRLFARMKIALENLLPEDATERYKYQILTDHLKCEEASLVADSYCNSWQPYTDTMQALTKMYGQPHKLAVQRIAELMDGSNIRSGDVKGFRLFALNVRSLVGMLQQLGLRGQVELTCGSHVSRLLSKLPHDLNASFKRFIHPLRVAIPTLVDFADWLEYELEVQEDNVRAPKREELFNKKPETKRTPKPTMYNCKVLLKISKVLLRSEDKCLETYAVLDDGSERTILLQSAAKQLGLKGSEEVMALRTVRQEVEKLHGAAVSFSISPAANPDKVYTIRNAFTSEQLSLAEHSHPVASLSRSADYTHLITPIEPVRMGPPGGPAAIKTLLGWTLQGPAQAIKSSSNVSHCLFTSAPSHSELFSCVEKLWQMDVLPYRSEKMAVRSRQDQEAVKLLQTQTVRVNVDGIERYATPLLRVKDMPLLKATPESVLPHLRGTEKRLVKAPEQAAAYQREIEKLVEAGYAVKLAPHQVESSAEAWYIPHHMVEHNGKNRVVYNCSFQHQGHNLNQLLLPGPTLGPALLAVLLRFREHGIAFSSDIRGMFHQVRLLLADRPLLRFLWRDMKRDNPPDVYEWQVLPFGTTCSPCCATFALQKHVIDHSQQEEDVQVAINKSFYVDNCLQSLTSPVAAKSLVDKLRHLLVKGGFELRQWASNTLSVVNHLPPELRSSSCELWLSQGQPDIQEPALGLHWNCNSIYYPSQGHCAPPVGEKRDWDDPQLPEELLEKWRTWEAELVHLPEITLPRCYTTARLDQPSSIRDIHVFCDASEQAYGSVAYLRTETPEGQVEVAFLAARSRVSPKKQQSVPRLELCAALTGAQLYKVISTELTLRIHSCTLWSDSATVLSWLSSDSCRYKVFVGTRVAEIQELTEAATWRYVPSKDNPADDITRGLTLQDISRGNRWTDGPPFLK